MMYHAIDEATGQFLLSLYINADIWQWSYSWTSFSFLPPVDVTKVHWSVTLLSLVSHDSSTHVKCCNNRPTDTDFFVFASLSQAKVFTAKDNWFR